MNLRPGREVHLKAESQSLPRKLVANWRRGEATMSRTHQPGQADISEYEAVVKRWRSRQDLNLRSADYEVGAPPLAMMRTTFTL